MAFSTRLQAVIQCDNPRCVFTEKHHVGAEEVSLQTFCADAMEHFEGRGWKTSGGIRCPQCAGGNYLEKAIAARRTEPAPY